MTHADLQARLRAWLDAVRSAPPTDDDALARRHGVRIVKDMVASIDPARKVAVLASGPTIAYDKLVLSPGVELMFDGVQGLRAAQAEGRILQAWKAGPETVALRRQLEAMRDGGTYAITVPEAPYRCPPAPRAPYGFSWSNRGPVLFHPPLARARRILVFLAARFGRRPRRRMDPAPSRR